MTYELYRYLFIGSTILASLMLLISVFLFIKWNIPKVIGDVSGHTSRFHPMKKKTVDGQTCTLPAPTGLTGETNVAADTTEELEQTILLASETYSGTGFEVEVDITFLHTDEIII